MEHRHTRTALGWIAGTVAFLLTTASAAAQSDPLGGRLSVAVEFGEIPFHGSFKAGISVGYHLNDHAWIGFAYQIPDSIRRNDSSFNAQGTGLAGLEESREDVSSRAAFALRIRPHRYAPHATLGFVYNGRDTEELAFDGRSRVVRGSAIEGPIAIRMSRAPGLRPALGLGYGYTHDSGVQVFADWAGWWMFGAPTPDLSIDGEGLTEEATSDLHRTITRDFESSPFNTYHVFQMGVGYTWGD